MNKPKSPIGQVFLVGAGPGDPGLITVRGAQKLGEADVILHDGLANPAFRSLASRNAEWISVGKHGGNRIWKQTEIDDAIVHFARLGKSVVRLKGGDTGVFARTSEELDRLVRESIPFEVIPGITAALAAAAYTGIPITHRDWSSAVALVTGQQQPSDGGPEVDEGIDWASLAKFPGTLVVYMGVTTASHWSNRLIEAGLSSDTPVALVRRCSWPDQKTLYCKLSEVAEALTPSSKFRPPVLAIIGTVAHLGSEYNWFERRPLKGINVLVARPAGQATETAKLLEDLGANVLVQSAIEISPLDDFTPLDARLNLLANYEWIVFTSTNGVEHFFSRLHALGFDGRALHHCRIAGVGPAIAAALERWKIVCDLIPDADLELFNAESLAIRLLDRFSEQQRSLPRTLVVRAMRGNLTVEESLRSAGYPVDSVVAYRSLDIQEFAPDVSEAIESSNIDYILVTSSSIASNLLRLIGTPAANLTWIAISEEVASVLRKEGIHKVLIAEQSSIDSMIAKLQADVLAQ